MIDKTDFSVNIDVNPAMGLKPLPDWIAFDVCKPYAVPGGSLLLHNSRNGKRAMVRPDVFPTLVNCSEFQTLDTHVNNIIEKQPTLQEHRADIRGVFEQMLESGIMRSAKSIVDELKNDPGAVDESLTRDKPVAAIITWERPQALKRLLQSIVANCQTGNLHCLYVIDDSRTDENIQKNQAVVVEFSEQLDTPLHYFGQADQQAFIGKLSAKLPAHEDAIRFLIDQGLWHDHWTSGLARNWAMVLSSGRRLLALDDDVICDVYDPPGLKPNITLSDAKRESDFFAGEGEWAHLRQAINPDPLDRHMQCLGLTLSQAIDVLGQQHLKAASLENATTIHANEFRADSPVLITEAGSLGCPGTSNNTWLPYMNSASLKKMLASQKKTSNALNTRKVWSGRSHPHFSPRSNMSQIIGMDNRQLLPPYIPIARGEDRLFGFMVDYIFPTFVALDYPWAVPHLPIPDREWQHKDLKFDLGPIFPFFFVDKVLEHRSTCQSHSPQDRLENLAALYRDLAGTSPESLLTMHQDNTLECGAEKLKTLDKLLAAAESAPVDWQNYLRNGLKQLDVDLNAASRDDFPVKGYPGNLGTEDMVSFWKETWVEFAEALSVWPEIRRAAAELVAEGMNS